MHADSLVCSSMVEFRKVRDSGPDPRSLHQLSAHNLLLALRSGKGEGPLLGGSIVAGGFDGGGHEDVQVERLGIPYHMGGKVVAGELVGCVVGVGWRKKHSPKALAYGGYFIRRRRQGGLTEVGRLCERLFDVQPQRVVPACPVVANTCILVHDEIVDVKRLQASSEDETAVRYWNKVGH